MQNIIFLVVGLVFILYGANLLTDGASAVAKRFHISDLVIGLTIVAFGTSMPEFVVSTFSSINGSADMAIGNVVGSNIFNILMIIGCTAIAYPIKVEEGTLTKQIPLIILSSVAVLVCANDIFLDDGVNNVIGRTDGILLLCFFAIFLGYTFAIAHNGKRKGEVKTKELPMWKSILFILLGLTGLIFGGDLFVDGASGVVRSLGVSESIIGLTLVAGGTSLPELATSIVAAMKHNSGIAIGNVIGSNLFNVFFVLGTSATIIPLSIGNITNVDLFMLLFASIFFWVVGWFFKKRTITRYEGVLLVACYIGYTAYLICQQ
jgi:cation:H+ antiporter